MYSLKQSRKWAEGDLKPNLDRSNHFVLNIITLLTIQALIIIIQSIIIISKKSERGTEAKFRWIEGKVIVILATIFTYL